jgi:hypothetical protein
MVQMENNTANTQEQNIDNNSNIDNNNNEQNPQTNILGGDTDSQNTKKTINLIDENSSDEEISEFYNALGRPEAADKYEINKPEDLPANIAWQDEELSAFKQVAFDCGLSQKQAENLVKFQTEMVKRAVDTQLKAHNAAAEKTIANLQKDFGADYEKNIAQANKAMEVFGLQEVFTRAKLLADEAVVRAMVKIGASISESKFIEGENPASEKAKYDELINDKNSAYYNASDPKHEEAVKTVMNFLNTKK